MICQETTNSSKSTTEAEYRALASTAVEITWITFILHDIGLPFSHPPTLFSDGISAFHLIFNPVFHARFKHIKIDYHFVHEKVAEGLLVAHFVPLKHQVANIFIKSLSLYTSL